MATYQKRGRTWRVMVRRQGNSLSASFDTRQEAEQWALRAEAAVLNGAGPGARQAAAGRTVADLLRRYAREVSPGKRGARWEQIRIQAFIDRWPVFGEPVAAFGARQAATWRDARLLDVSALTVNRELNLLSAVYQQAIKEWQVVDVNPIRAIKRPELPRSRTQRAPEDARTAIAEALGWDGESTPATSSQWTAWTFWLACETALRQGEILGLQRRHIHLGKSYLHLARTKNGDSRDVPLSSRAKALLSLVPSGPADGRLVPVQAGHLGVLFRRARGAAGLPDLRFHDSRREATTEMSKKLSMLELMRAVGHRSPRSVQVYYAPDVTEMAEKLG